MNSSRSSSDARTAFGELLRARRVFVGMGHEELAQRMNLPPSEVLGIERGAHAPTWSEGMIVRAARHLLTDREPLLEAAQRSLVAYQSWKTQTDAEKTARQIALRAERLSDALGSGFVIDGTAYAVAPTCGASWLWVATLGELEPHLGVRTEDLGQARWRHTHPLPRQVERHGPFGAARRTLPEALEGLGVDMWLVVLSDECEEYEVRCLATPKHVLEEMGEFDGW